MVGSTLVCYKYAEELALRGHQVDVWHPASDPVEFAPIRRMIGTVWARRKRTMAKPVPWHEFGPGVVPRFTVAYSGLRLDHEVVVGFSWRGIQAMSRIETRGRRFGYVMEYETWAEAEPTLKARMEAAYLSGPPLLCSSLRVAEMLREIGVRDVRPSIQGIDVDGFSGPGRSSRGPEIRVGFPVRDEPVKSPEVLEATLAALRRRHPAGVVLWGFGGINPPREIVSKLDEYHPLPSRSELARLYAGSSIFAVPSRKEGFGMPAAEAMASGCSVVSVDNGGVRTYGVHQENCLLVPPDSPEALAAAISELVDDPVRMSTLSRNAPASVEFLRWTHAGERFIEQIGID